MSGQLFGGTAEDYRKYRASFPNSLFSTLVEKGVGLPRQSVVDLGTGTGSLARGFARAGCEVTGVDPDMRMLAQARTIDLVERSSVRYRKGTAEKTGLDDKCADVVSAGQCWHWFDQPKALTEVTRILKPGGKLAIVHFDWLPLKNNVVDATETLIEIYNPEWKMGGGNGMYPQWLPMLSEFEFQDITTFSYDLAVPYTHEAWCGRVRASAGVAVMDQSGINAFSIDLQHLLKTRFNSAVLDIPHRVFAILCNRPS